MKRTLTLLLSVLFLLSAFGGCGAKNAARRYISRSSRKKAF